MSHIEANIKSMASTIERPSDVTCVGLLANSEYSSGSRAGMLTQHAVQATVPEKGDVNATSSGHEHMFGHYSGTYKKTGSNTIVVIAKINKFRNSNMSYMLVVYDSVTKEYDVVKRSECKSMAEYFGFRNNNEEIDSLQVDDEIEPGTTLFRSPTRDEHGNFRYGINANIVYAISQNTIEDATEISVPFSKRASFTKVDNCRIPLNENDVPVNTYGDSEHYKSFADIGDYTKDSIIFVSRRKDNKTAHYTMKNSNLMKIFPNDDVFQVFGDWQIVDIDMWCNKKSIDDIPNTPAYAQVKRYYEDILLYHTNTFKILGDIISSADENDHTYSTELSRMFAVARDILDPNCKMTDNDRVFSNMIIQFTFAKSEKLGPGGKVTGLCGNKSVVSKVSTQEEIGYTSDGRPIDMVIDGLGVVGRLNTMQSFSQELNWVGDSVKLAIMETDILGERWSILKKYLKACKHEEYYNAICFKYELLSVTERIEFFEELINDRIYKMQEPMNSITGDDLMAMYEEFSPKLSDIYIHIDGEKFKTRRKCIVAEEYILILKHIAQGKYSIRGKALINPSTNLPCKSLLAKKKKSLFSDFKWSPYTVMYMTNMVNLQM